MKITLHIGAHQTDNDMLMKSLIRSNAKLAHEGIFIPGPSRYRDILREVSTRLKGAPANPETLDLVLDTILDTTEANHIVLSDQSFICAPPRIMDDDGYYAKAGYKTSWLRNTFPGHDVRFALGIRNPATHIPAVFKSLHDGSYAEFMAGVDPLTARWSDAIHDIREDNPDCPLIVWCNEDTPLIWPEVMREVSDHDPATRLKGGFDILAQIMEPEGMKQLRIYMHETPLEGEDHRRDILVDFLEKYAIRDQIEEVVDLPGWTTEVVEAMTRTYEEDLVEIRQIPGVTFITP